MDSELTFNNKKFLSSKSAGELAGYTNDYVARLCRQEKVRGRMVGRTWYVEEESFLHFINGNSQQKEKRNIQLSEERKQEYNEAPSQQKESKIVGALLSFKEVYSFKKIGALAVAVFLIFVAGHSAYDIKNGNENVFVETAISVSDFAESTGELFAEEGIKGTSAALAQQTRSAMNNSIASVRESINSFFGFVWKLATNPFRRFVAVNDDVSLDDGGLDFDSGTEPLASGRERDGVVVVPSASLDENEAQKKEIQDAFSDEINIIPDDDGQSGIIKPVFKEPGDQEYLYVLVPVDERVAEK